MKNSAQKKSQKTKEKTYRPSRATRLFTIWRKLRKSKLAIAGISIIIFMALTAILAPIIAPYSPSWIGTSRLPPSMDNIFGTDNLGRDLLTLVMYGARISLYVGVAAVLIEMVIGIGIGMIAGYFGGLIDEILMRITDVIFSLPAIMMLLLAISMFATRGENIIIVIMGILDWPFMARIVRGEYLSLRETTYVEAAKSMGASGWRIMFRHILPNMLSVIIVLATMDIPWFIFYEATLTFLGFGDPSSASWGVLLQNGYMFAMNYWWMIAFPGLAILFTSLGFNLLGDGLRDALDVKVRE